MADIQAEHEAIVRAKLQDVPYCVGFFAFQSARIQLGREDVGNISDLELAGRIGSLAQFDFGGITEVLKRLGESAWPASLVPASQLYEDMAAFDVATAGSPING